MIMESCGIDILWASRYHYDGGRGLSAHSHAFGQLIYFLDGGGTLCCGNASHPFVPGSLLLVAPDMTHGFVSRSGSKIRTIDVKFRLLESVHEQAINGCGGYYADGTGEIKALLDKVLAEGIGKQPHYGLIARLVLLHALYSIARLSDGRIPGEPAKTKEGARCRGEPAQAADIVERHMRRHCAEELTLERVARQVGYSKAHVGDTIRRRYGCSFAQFVRKLRVEQAKAFICESDLPLKRIAESVGFKTIHHFTRVFKQVEGMSPGRWKARETAGIGKDIHFD